MINRPRRGETPLHYSTKEGAWRCTIILLRKGALMKENGDGQVPELIKTAIQGRHGPVLEEVVRLNRETFKFHFQDDYILEILQQGDQGQSLLMTSLSSPALVRSTLDLLMQMTNSVPKVIKIEINTE